jgi:glycosyltransferase involved in cell wall biosynthesis
MLNNGNEIMNETNPLISVIMPVYNAEKYVKEAIESILNQTFPDWELIIIDDCSTDNSIEIIQSFQDERIILLKNEINLGVSKAPNKGIRIALGKYVTKMDADDISLPTRFKKQVEFLEKHPDYVLCASNVQMFGTKQDFFVLPTEDQQLKIALLYQNPFVHSSVLIRSKNCKKYLYNEIFPFAEDYELWINLKEEGKFASIPEILTKYRIHQNNLTSTIYGEMSNRRKELLIICQLKKLKIYPSEEELFIHTNFANLKGRKDIDANTFLPQLKKWMQKLLDANAIHSVYNQKDLELMLAFRWILAACFLNKFQKIVPLPFRKNIFSYPYFSLAKLFYHKIYAVKK